MPEAARVGVRVDSGATDWQIVQQDADLHGAVSIEGSWTAPEQYETVRVLVRIVREDGGAAVTAALDWAPAEMLPGSRWRARFSRIPAGGAYRIETSLQVDDGPLEWAARGDMIHHLGVGDIWLIAGQSNAVGYGKTPVEDGPEPGVHAFASDGKWKLATHPLGDSTGTIFPANAEYANASHSPWLRFAKRLRRALGYPIGLVPTALGGSSVTAWDRETDGTLFENMTGYLRGCGAAVRGVVWYQGESDVAPEARREYPRRFGRFVRDLRRELGAEHLPVITVQLNRYVGVDAGTDADADWEAMREIQRRLSHEIPGVFVFPVFEAGLSDSIHNDSHGNLLIGDRAAHVALGAVYGRDVSWRHPECVEAVATGPTSVSLRFENVEGRLNYENVVRASFAFAVRDRAGANPLTACTVTDPDRVELRLQRPLDGKATVTGAPTASPPRDLPVTIPGYRSILGFTLEIDASGA